MKGYRFPKKSYAFIDGSYNPKTKVYGCGGFLIDQFGEKHLIKASGKNEELSKMRNVAGEILGARRAISLAKKLYLKKLTLFYDYEGIANWPLGIWEPKNKYTKRYARYVWRALNNGLKLYFVHVKGHSGIAGNVEADRLAREAVGLIKRRNKNERKEL